jgi:hypothetical protein
MLILTICLRKVPVTDKHEVLGIIFIYSFILSYIIIQLSLQQSIKQQQPACTHE